MTEYISDSCEKFQRCYTDTGSWHAFSHTHTHTDMTEVRMIYLTIVRSFRDVTVIHRHWLMAFFSPPHTHTHTDMTDARIIYLTIVRSFRDITRILAHGINFHTHTHTHGAFINGTHNTIMEKSYQWCCSWYIHTTTPMGETLLPLFRTGKIVR